MDIQTLSNGIIHLNNSIILEQLAIRKTNQQAFLDMDQSDTNRKIAEQSAIATLIMLSG
jgi:hypothetical protein